MNLPKRIAKSKMTVEEVEKLRRDPPKVLCTHEIAALYNIPLYTAQEWTRHPTFPGQRTRARSTIYVDYKDLRKWLKKRFKLAQILS